jgi:hypothetical protein
MKLYEYAYQFAELFDSLDAIADYIPEQDENGQYIDDDGNIISDVDSYKSDMQTAWFDTLDGIEGEFDIKAENIACYIKQLSGDVELLKKEKASIDRRKKAKENQLESMKRYLLECMKKTKRLKIETPKAKISVKNNQETSRFENEKAFIKMCMEKNLEEYLRYKDPEINKTAVKNALRSGEIVPGAQLERTQSLIIK